MRLVKVLFTGLIAVVAILAGLVLAAATAVGLAAFFLVRRLLRSGRSQAAPRGAASNRDPEVIEVTATEVPAGKLEIGKS